MSEATGDEFDAIEAPTREISVGGQVFVAGPVTIDRLPAFTRALRPIMPAVAELASLSDDADPDYVMDTLLDLVSENGELMHEALAVAVAVDREDIPTQRARVGKLNAADFVLLALPVVKANVDFFARRLLPLLLQARGQAKPDGVGSTLSSH